jgi:dTDP-4-amino-4,6-dideoxygalactose transaminase
MTTGGEGGMVTTDDDELWRRGWSYKDHGKSYAAVYERAHPPGFRWLHEDLGSNWRLTEMQSAIGRRQLAKLEAWLALRRRNTEILITRLSRLDALRIPTPPAGVRHAWYKFYAFVRPDALASGWTRDRIMAEIASAGVFCGSGSCPEIYRERALVSRKLGPTQPLPIARELGATSLMFLVHPTLDEAAMHHAADVVAAVLAQATR